MTHKDTEIQTEVTICMNNNTCRVCMCRQKEMTDIFDAHSDIAEKIIYCTGLQISKDDGLPTQICTKCAQDLTIAHKFKTSCILANDTFQKIVKNLVIKTEIEYDDEDGFSDGIDIKEEPEEMENVKTDDNDVSVETQVKRGPRGPYKKRNKSAKPQKKRKYTFRKLFCETCQLGFKNKAERDAHHQNVHDGQLESWICEHCGKIFKNKSSMYSHSRTHLPPQYFCDQCDYSAQYKHDMAKHLLMHAGLKLYQCQICARRFCTASGLSTHIHREHEGAPKRYQCELCEKSFFDKTKYNRHIDSHNNVKRFECEVCNSFFTRRCYWKKHRFLKHNIVMPRERPGRPRAGYVVRENKDSVV